MARASISKKSKDSFIIIIIGIAIGLLYPLLSREFDDIGALINGLLIGLVGSGFIVLNEIVYSRPRMRRMKFNLMVAYKSIMYSGFFILLILLVVSITRAIEQNIGLFNFIGSKAFYSFIWHEDFHIIVIYALAATTIFIFIYQLSRKMGQGELWNFISGKYHKPREEERIFMFLDLNDSTPIAEELGDIEYNKLLNDCFFDITDSILSNYGQIYRYVGDEVVISWSLNNGLANAHCLRTYFQAVTAIHLKREQYFKLYHRVPSFSAGLHFGKVIVGEIGEVKSQICFIGNVMYETTEIEKNCKKFKANILVSDDLLEQIDLPSIYKSEQEGVIDIPGFSSIKISSVNEKNMAFA